MFRNTKRHYVHYLEWEDYKAGMWGKLGKFQEVEMLKTAIDFTGNHEIYVQAMMEVVWKWPRTMLHNLTNLSINRRAFLGHCACSFKIKCPEYITRQAWWHLSEVQRQLANDIADKTIKHWFLSRNIKQLSFDFRD